MITRRQWLGLVMIGLAVIALLVLLFATTSPRSVDAPPATVDRTPTPTATPIPGSPEANAPYTPSPGAEEAMRTFLDGYLAYIYGRGGAEAIRRAAPTLREELASHPPRVSPAQQQRDPRIVAIRSRRPGSGRVKLIATINAGETSEYPIGAVLVERDGRWQVARLLNDE